MKLLDESVSGGSIELYLRCPNLTALWWGENQPFSSCQYLQSFTFVVWRFLGSVKNFLELVLFRRHVTYSPSVERVWQPCCTRRARSVDSPRNVPFVENVGLLFDFANTPQSHFPPFSQQTMLPFANSCKCLEFYLLLLASLGALTFSICGFFSYPRTHHVANMSPLTAQGTSVSGGWLSLPRKNYCGGGDCVSYEMIAQVSERA